jgi:uncharacterized protein YcnI
VRRVAVVVAAAMLVPAAGAAAHVAIKPPRAAAGSEARLTLEVPNERPAAATRKIDLQMPAGVTAVRARALRGWKLRVREAGGEVRRVTLTAGAGRALTGDQRGRFGLRMTLPATPGRTLVFKVLQTYDNGEVVRWIGPPGTSEPPAGCGSERSRPRRRPRPVRPSRTRPRHPPRRSLIRAAAMAATATMAACRSGRASG